MPTKLVTIKSTRKENYGEPVEVNAYYWTPENEPLGVIFGHFAPFTGKYGHARMMYEAQKYGIEKFVVVMPPSKGELDDNRNLFTDEQRVKIVKEGCKELGIDIIDCWIDEQKVPAAILGLIQRRFSNNRIVICCGPDREKSYARIAIPFSDDNKPTLDPNDPDFRKQEMIVCADRGEQEVSGTAVRELLKTGDKATFKKMTGYSDLMWNMMRNFINENGVVELEESFADLLATVKTMINEDIQATGKNHIHHLYNPGNAMQIKPQDFLEVIDWLKKQNGKLDDRINVSYSEKCDGLPCRFGLDDDGQFFLEQGKSGPIFDADEFTNRDKDRVGFATRMGAAWKNVFKKLNSNSTVMNILKKHNTSTGIKIICEVFINAVANKGDTDDLVRYIGTQYYKSKMGSFCSFVIIGAIDGEGNDIKEFDQIRKELLKASSETVMFDDTNYSNKFGEIDFNDEIAELEAVINDLETEYGNDIKSILADTSRKKDDLAKKKKIKETIQEYQGKFDRKIQSLFDKTDGKWGPEREGIVLKLANDVMLKITSDTFKKFHDATKNKNDEYGFNKHKEWIFGPADEE